MKTLAFYMIFEVISLFFLFVAQKMKEKDDELKHNENIKNKKNIIQKYYLYLIMSAIPLIILIGFRDISVGYDTSAYVETFFRITKGEITASDGDWLSIGYIAICKLIGLFSDNNYVLYNTIIGILTVFFFYKAIMNNSKNSTFSLYLLFSTCLFYQTFNQSRQMLAIAIVLYSWKFIENNKMKKFLFFILLAFSIHKSAIIMMPFYWLTKAKINYKNIMLYIIFAFSIFAFFDVIQKMLLLTHYGQVYTERGMFISQTSTWLNLSFRFLIVILCMIFYKYTRREEKKSLNKLINVAIWCILFQLLTVKVYIFGRITTYLYVFFILLIPNLFENIENKNIKITFKTIMISIFFIFHIGYYYAVSQASGYDIYQFFF